jgi:hypothetical protein
VEPEPTYFFREKSTKNHEKPSKIIEFQDFSKINLRKMGFSYDFS